MEKITLKLNLTENPERTSIFNILDTENKLRPEIVALIEEGILKYFNAPSSKPGILITDTNEHLTLTVSAQTHLKERTG